MKLIEKAKRVVKRLLNILVKPQMLILPGQLAFFFLLAVVPMITLILYGASLFHFSYDFIGNFLLKAFGGEIKDLIMPIIEEIKFTPNFVILVVISFLAASAGTSSLIITSNQLYQCENTSYLKRKIKSLIMTFILIILILFLLLIPAFGDRFIEMIKYVNMNETVTAVITFIINLSKGPVSWLLIFLLIKIIYTLAPDTDIPSRATTKGAIFTTLGFVIATGLYSFYVSHFAHYDILYGGLSHFVVLMLWFYIIAYVIVIAIAINAEEAGVWKK